MSIPATKLDEAVALMKEKSWRQLMTVGDLVLSTGEQGEGVYGFGHEAIWEPTSQQLLFVGAGHHDPMTFNIYKAETNSWRTEGMDRLRVAGEELQDHSYDHLAGDDQGNFYFIKNRLNIFNVDSNVWTATYTLDHAGISAFEFFPELKALFYLINGTVSFYHPETNTWEWNTATRSMGSMHQIAEYNRVHHVMVFGGGTGSRLFYVMDSARTIRALKPAPFDMELTTCLMAADPVSGKMLVLKSQDSLYAWDIMADTWETVCKIPISNFNAQQSVIAHIDDHGVIAVLGYQYPVVLFKYQDSEGNKVENIRMPVRSDAFCYPNPFSSSTRIHLPAGSTGFSVFNSNGRLIKRLQGSGDIRFDCRVPAGVYYGKIASDNGNTVFPMFVIE